MSDPRYTDPRYSNSQLSDPVGRRGDGAGVWGWIAGIVVIALIAIFLIAGSKNVNTANNGVSPPASTTGLGTTPRGPAPSTTGMGGSPQFPAKPPANQK